MPEKYVPPRKDTYVLDPEDTAEMTRLMLQDRMITKGMGGIFSEYGNHLPAGITRVLDVGCGPGGWVLDVAYAHPQVKVTGLDISHTMITYARARAKAEGRRNAEFAEGNILEPLAFPDNYFGLVNARFMIMFLQRYAWPVAVRELYRITAPGGIIRLTECDTMGSSNSPSLQKILGWFYLALHRSGYGFSPDGRDCGMTPVLGKLLADAGCVKIQVRPYALDFSHGTEFFQTQYENYMIGLQLAKPLFVKTGVASEEEFTLAYDKMIAEMLDKNFRAYWHLFTAWGYKP